MEQFPQGIVGKGQRRPKDAFCLKQAAEAAEHCPCAQEKALGGPQKGAGHGLDSRTRARTEAGRKDSRPIKQDRMENSIMYPPIFIITSKEAIMDSSKER